MDRNDDKFRFAHGSSICMISKETSRSPIKPDSLITDPRIVIRRWFSILPHSISGMTRLRNEAAGKFYARENILLGGSHFT